MIPLLLIIISGLGCSTGNIGARSLMGRLFITVTEAAKILELDPRTLRRSIEAGECPAIRISGTVRIPLPAFLRWAGIDLEDSEGEPGSSPIAPTPTPLKRLVYRNDSPPAAWRQAPERGRRGADRRRADCCTR
jgi:excisionase family DNA binding protein